MKQESEPDRYLAGEGSGEGKRMFLPRDRNKLASSGTERRQVWQ